MSEIGQGVKLRKTPAKSNGGGTKQPARSNGGGTAQPTLGGISLSALQSVTLRSTQPQPQPQPQPQGGGTNFAMQAIAARGQLRRVNPGSKPALPPKPALTPLQKAFAKVKGQKPSNK